MMARTFPNVVLRIAAGLQFRGCWLAVCEGGNSPSAPRRLCAPLAALTICLVAVLLGAPPFHTFGKGLS